MITEDDHGYQTDYIYANGKRIAKGMVEARVIRMQVTQCTGCSERFTVNGLGSWNGYTIKSGDKLFLYETMFSGTSGGMTLWFDSNATNTDGALDQNGVALNADTNTAFHLRRFDLSSYAGKVISKADLVIGSGTSAGSNRGAWFQDVVIVSTDGSVYPLWNGQLTFGTTANGTASSPVQDVQRLSPAGVYPDRTTTYYHADHLGSSRMTSNAQGYPIWTGTYLPYGWEYNPRIAIDHYKFTGKERDSESGLDYFGARYYGSSYGRFMSPDWAEAPTAVPYANFGDPQSMNLYAYAGNSPLARSDKDGHCDSLCASFINVVIYLSMTSMRISGTRSDYNQAIKGSSPLQRDQLKSEFQSKGPAIGRAMAQEKSADPARQAARAAKSTEQLAESAGRASPSVNSAAKAIGRAGQVGAVVAVAAAAYDVSQAPSGEKLEVAAEHAGGFAGALAGGEVGGEIGFGLGAGLTGTPAGAALGATLGGIGGAIAGGIAGKDAVSQFKDDINKIGQFDTSEFEAFGDQRDQ